jgi:hypothetical protein
MPVRAAPLPARALAIGTFPLHALDIFAGSHWSLEREATSRAAAERLAHERFAAVLCPASDWREVAETVGFLNPSPVIIALSNDPPGDDWLDAIAKHVYFLDLRQLSAPELFPLLNHAWRTCNRSSC